MNALTPEAAKLIDEMLAAGWQVRFRADPVFSETREWEFARRCLSPVPGCGLFWKIGLDADIFAAAARARENAEGYL